MPLHIDRLGLMRTLFLTFAGAFLLCLAFTGAVVNRVARTELENALRVRAASGARFTAGRLASALAAGRSDVLAAELESALREQDDAYVAVLRADGSVAAQAAGPAFSGRIEASLARHARDPRASFFLQDGVYAFFEPIHVEQRGDVRRQGGTESGPLAGHLVRGYDAVEVDGPVAHLELTLMSVAGLASLALGGLLFWLSRRLVMQPLTRMRQVASRISERDLGARAPRLSDDELGLLADALNGIGENLTATFRRMNGVSEGVGQVIERIAKTSSQVSEGTGTVEARVTETGASMGQMLASLRGIAGNVEVLAHSADESSASIRQMAAANGAVAEDIQALAASVEETTAAIEQMTCSIKEVARNVEDLSATAEETSASMNEMDVSIGQVENNANETARLSEQAMKDAELSTEALSRTLAGIGRIKESSREAASVIDSLGRKIGTVGNILNVIDEVAEQTNLLALNAAILAAQSGEHGKGFAVVADEIKDLAERTGASTKEIAELVRSVQDESANAVAAMDVGVRNVEEGVRLGQEAEAALRKIQASSVKSTQMVKAIARATIEQARGSKQVTMAIHRIAETVLQIAAATAGQARGSEQIVKSAEKMRVITKHVEHSSQEQAQGSKQITRAIESISDMVNRLNRAQKEQTAGSELVVGAVDQIKQVAEAQTSSVKELAASIFDLAQQADLLRDEVARFRM